MKQEGLGILFVMSVVTAVLSGCDKRAGTADAKAARIQQNGFRRCDVGYSKHKGEQLGCYGNEE